MELRDRAIALYGRFQAGERERLVRAICEGGGTVARDLTRRSDLLVVGALATPLIDSGALIARLHAARDRGVPVMGERRFAAALAGGAPGAAPTAPLATALAGTSLTAEAAELLAAFDLIRLQDGSVGFGDRAVLRTAAELIAAGRPMGEVVRILARAREIAPRGRHRIVLTAGGQAALKWDDGVTSLEGQGYLPLDEDHATIEDLFEAAAVAEAAGDLPAAARLYDLCARADRADAIAPYNLGNIRLAEGGYPGAILAYQQALARDPKFVEARYNLSQAFEGAGKVDDAAKELDRLLGVDPDHGDALFNLAQLQMRGGEIAGAKRLYERYLALGPSEPWAAKARQAILYCDASMRAG
jgi:tetratricopeptide (TPR) repeat protein